jgi:hypothetical protein
MLDRLLAKSECLQVVADVSLGRIEHLSGKLAVWQASRIDDRCSLARRKACQCGFDEAVLEFSVSLNHCRGYYQ